MASSPLPSVRRVVTGHNCNGEATVLRDELQQAQNGVHGIYRTDEFPARNDAELKGEWVDTVTQSESLIAHEGAVFRSYDMAPGSVVPFHRTQSLDLGIVIKGSLILELQNGETVTLKEGDTIIQRGTFHAWRNESNEWVRLYFVALGARPIEVNGEVLPETLL